jgi:hypothetical protein
MKWIFLPIMIFVSVIAVAQKPAFIYEFNKNGELVKGPPAIFPANHLFNLRIPFDTIFFHRQIDSVLGNVLQAKIYWTSVQKKLTASPDPGLYSEVVKLVGDLDAFYTTLYGRSSDDLLKVPIVKTAHNYYYVPPPDSLIYAMKIQVMVKIQSSGMPCRAETQLPLSNNCGWSYSLPSDSMASQDLEIDLYKLDPLKTFLIDRYNSKLSSYPYEYIGLFEKAIAEDSALLEQVKKYTKMNIEGSSGPHGDSLCKEVVKLDTVYNQWIRSSSLSAYEDLKTGLPNLQAWLFSFVWQNPGGRLRLNPFSFTDPVYFRSMTKKPSGPDPVDTLIRKKMDDFLTSKDPVDIKTYKDIMLALYKRDSLKNKMDSMSLVASNKFQSKDSSGNVSNASAFWSFQQTAFLRNRVRTPVSCGPDSIHIRNYYFNRLPEKTDFRYQYPENEKVILALHNKPANTGTSNTEQKVSYNEQPLITEEGLAEIGSGATTLPAATTAAVANANGTNGSSFQTASLVKVISQDSLERFYLVQLPQGQSCKKNFLELQEKLKASSRKPLMLDSLYNLSQWPPSPLEKIPNDSPQLRTELRFPDGASKAPYLYTYKLAVKDTSKSLSLINPIDSSGYRVGKRRLVELALGVAYSFTSVRQTNITSDTAGNLVPSSIEQKVQFIVGLKFHLKKIYWENNRFAFSSKSWHDGTLTERLSFFLAVSIPQPLHNIYTGFGVDLIPGLNINSGIQWYQYTNYSLNNNIIIDQTVIYRPAWYIAVTADPTLVINIVKTFFN